MFQPVLYYLSKVLDFAAVPPEFVLTINSSVYAIKLLKMSYFLIYEKVKSHDRRRYPFCVP